jgi:Fe-Mn family superoxide dismutase
MEAKKFESIRELKGISERTMTEHYKLYEGYVKKSNEIIGNLADVDVATANQIYSDIRALKVELSFALGGVKNHEIYFGHLGGEGGKPSGKLLEQIEKDFGSFEKWQEDLTATGMSGRGWAWLVYDWDLGKLMNYLGDSQNSYPVWNCSAILALDVYEHAYFMDFGIKRADYIKVFFDNLDWKVIEKSFAHLRL